MLSEQEEDEMNGFWCSFTVGDSLMVWEKKYYDVGVDSSGEFGGFGEFLMILIAFKG